MPDYFIPNPADTEFPFAEDWEISQWIAEGGATVVHVRYASDTDHPSCLEVVSDTDAKGVYHTVADVDPETKYAFEFSYKNAATQELDYLVYDNTGSATIVSGTLTKTVWSYHYEEFTTPTGCVEIIIYLRAGTANNVAFYIDDLSLQGNILEIDPDDVSISYPKQGMTKKSLDGTLRTDNSLATIDFNFSFPILSADGFDRLLEFHKSRKETYLDDQDVPAMIETGILYTEIQYDFVGITKGSGPEYAYEDKSASEPAAQGDFETNEIETADYNKLDDDDNNSYQDSASTTGHYVYHKFVFDVSGEYTAASDVQSFELTYKGKSNDASSANDDGVTLYAWNASAGNWVKLGATQVSTKETISISLMKPEQAQLFVDTSGGEINILVQSNGTKGAGTALTIDSYYIEATVNKSLSNTIFLLNRAVLTAGDVVHVKNKTDFTTLTLTTHYTIGDDGKSVIMVSEDDGDVIEVKYNQYYRIGSVSFSERRQNQGGPTAPNRSARLQLRGLIGLE
jgi:hypothetical protein